MTAPDIVKNKAPLYSMTSRNMMPGDGTTKPGPGAHSPEKVSILPDLLLILMLIFDENITKEY